MVAWEWADRAGAVFVCCFFWREASPRGEERVAGELPESCWWWNNMLLITNLPIPLLVATSYSNTRRAFLGSATSVATSAIIIAGPPQDDDGTLS